MGFRRVRVLVGCCFEWEWDRFLLDWDGGAVEEFSVVVSIGSGAIVLMFFGIDACKRAFVKPGS